MLHDFAKSKQQTDVNIQLRRNQDSALKIYICIPKLRGLTVGAWWINVDDAKAFLCVSLYTHACMYAGMVY